MQKAHILPINPGKNHFVSAMNLSYRSAGSGKNESAYCNFSFKLHGKICRLNSWKHPDRRIFKNSTGASGWIQRPPVTYENEQFGIIIRTNAKGVPFQEVEDEIERLKEEYKKLLNTALSRVAFSRLKSAPPTYISDLKNVYMEGMEEIVIEGKDLYTEIQEYFLQNFLKK